MMWNLFIVLMNVYRFYKIKSVMIKISTAGMGYSLNIYNQDAD